MRTLSLSILLFFYSLSIIFAQNTKKEFKAQITETSIKIDGNMSEPAWENAETTSDFTQISPNPEKPSLLRTEVKVLYDNNAIYIGAKLWDTHPDSIQKELVLRDNIGNADWFSVNIDTYQSKIEGSVFLVTAAGVQRDARSSDTNGEDSNWNAVWESKVKINTDNWTVEIAIPYSALRFAKAAEQKWYINFGRHIRRYRETSWWNEVKPAINGFFTQSGIITNIKNIEPPVRLALFPYISANIGRTKTSGTDPYNTRGFNAGMDIKYGISDAFTLDMTLVPDFGQVQSDNKVLNLSPFQVQFNENRQFFTEGTELFNKADIFYSRRIGATPTNFYNVYDKIGDKEKIIKNPANVQLLNSTKLSGRFKNGLGMGILNSITAPTYATVQNTETNETRKLETEPLSNYNIFVLDQLLKNNSSVSLINTNVMRNGSMYDANVTAATTNINDKTNTYQISATGAISQKYYAKKNVELGYRGGISFTKTSGNWQYSVWNSFKDKKYDHNDLGFLMLNNINETGIWGARNFFKPFGKFLSANINGNISYTRLVNPNKFQNLSFNFNTWATTKTQITFGIWAGAEPVITYDFFEPRTYDGRYYTFPRDGWVGGFLSTDYRKSLAVDVNLNLQGFENQQGVNGRYQYYISIAPRWRASDRFSTTLRLEANDFYNSIGFASFGTDEAVIFGRRDVKTKVATLSAKYNFSPLMGLNFRLRHYWSQAKYFEFYDLGKQDGLLYPTNFNGFPDPERPNHSVKDISYNFFNIDMVYSWQFAPGSQMSIVWKNAIFREHDNSEKEMFFRNLRNTFDRNSNLADKEYLDINNNISIKILYYLDYWVVKQKYFSKKIKR